MASVSQFCHFVAHHPQRSAEPLTALGNFLRAHSEANTRFAPETINSFFLDALHHPQWQSQKAVFFDAIRLVLGEFLKVAPDPAWDPNALLPLADLQILSIENAGEFYRLVKKCEDKGLAEGEKARVLPDGEERMVAILLKSDHRLVVRSYRRSFYLRNAELLPLFPEQQLTYSPDLELERGTLHWVRQQDLSTIRFRATGEGVRGWVTSGASFKAAQSFSLPQLASEPKLFLPVKRLERFFIHRPSDPFYAQILGNLEKAVELLRRGSPQAGAFARSAFERGQAALDTVFPDDKALYRLLRELATTLTLRGQTLIAGANAFEGTQIQNEKPRSQPR